MTHLIARAREWVNPPARIGAGCAARLHEAGGARPLTRRKLRREFSFPDPRRLRPRRARRPARRVRGHHPDIELGWGRAPFTLTTHVAGSLSRNDFIMAARIDRLADG